MFLVAGITVGWTVVDFTPHISVISYFIWLYFLILLEYISWMVLLRGMATFMILTRWVRLSRE